MHATLERRTDPTWPTTWFVPRLTGSGAFTDVYAVMNNVGIRAEHRYDEWTTTFQQISLDGEHRQAEYPRPGA